MKWDLDASAFDSTAPVSHREGQEWQLLVRLLSQLYGSVSGSWIACWVPFPNPFKIMKFYCFFKPIRLNCLEISKIRFSILIHFSSPESVVTQFCLSLCNLLDCSPPGSSVHLTLQERILEWVVFPPLGGLPDPGIEPGPSVLQADSLPSESPGILPNKWVCWVLAMQKITKRN